MKRLWFLLALAPHLAWANVDYSVTPDPAAGTMKVRMTLDKAGEKPVFRIPTWCPGFYVVLKYQDKLSQMVAKNAKGDPLELKTIDPRTWEVANPSKGSVTMEYTVTGDDPGLGFFGVSVLAHTAFINGPAAFLYADGRKEDKVKLTVNNPAGWDVATSLDVNPSGGWDARDYDHLLDCPIRLGKFERRKFTSNGVPFEAVFASRDGTYRTDLDDAVRQMKAVSEATMSLFPKRGFKHYMYHVHLGVGSFGGGLEHQSSTVLAVFPSPKISIEALAAHEFYHAWNVKQIRPKALGPFDYTKPVRVRELWLNEGVTDYYGHLIPYQAGLFDESWLLRTYTGQIRQLQGGKTRLTKTAEDASLEAWEGFSQGTGDLSYYNKGFVIGICLDAAIRGATKGRKSLDDVMRLLYERHYLPKPGFEEGAIIKTINEVTGQDLTPLYDQMIRSTKEMPYEVLEEIGLRVRIPGKVIPDVGFSLSGNIVTVVDSRNDAKLKIGDEILSLNGQPFQSFDPRTVGKEFTFKIKRGESTLDVPMSLLETEPTRFQLEVNPFATAEQQARLAEYLKR